MLCGAGARRSPAQGAGIVRESARQRVLSSLMVVVGEPCGSPTAKLIGYFPRSWLGAMCGALWQGGHGCLGKHVEARWSRTRSKLRVASQAEHLMMAAHSNECWEAQGLAYVALMACTPTSHLQVAGNVVVGQRLA